MRLNHNSLNHNSLNHNSLNHIYLNHYSVNQQSPNSMRPMRGSGFLGAKQRGSMLVIAVFVIIVFSLLGLTLTRMLASSSDAIIHEVYGLRALSAARTGVEQAISAAFPLAPEAPSCNAAPVAPVNFNSNIKGLENCSYVAGCEAITVTDGATYTYYRFESTGSCLVGEILVSRRISVDALQ
jgi:MSHA biogenesis protein MshP